MAHNTQKHVIMPKTTVGFSVEPETKERLNSLFPPEMLGEEKLKLLIGAYENKESNAEQPELDVTNSPLYVELSELYQKLETNFNTCNVEKLDLETKLSELQSKHDILKENAFPSENEIVLSISPATRELLNLVQERLTKKLNKTITAENLLIDTFILYNYRQWNDMFYPFVAQKSEVFEIFKKYNPDLSGKDIVS